MLPSQLTACWRSGTNHTLTGRPRPAGNHRSVILIPAYPETDWYGDALGVGVDGVEAGPG